MLTRVSYENYSITYFKYNKIDHKIFKCNIYKNGYTYVKQIEFQRKLWALTPMNLKKVGYQNLENDFIDLPCIQWHEMSKFLKNGWLGLKIDG